MQTEQFDDEFRKRLLGIDPVTSEDEVDRIYNYVSSNGNTVSGFSWTRVLLYGLVASMLIGSLTFNYIQNLTNKQLFSSLDSLKAQVISIDNQNSQKVTLRVDTVFVNRYLEKTILAEIHPESLYARQNAPDPFGHPNYDEISGESVKNVYSKPADSLGKTPFETGNLNIKSSAQNNESGLEVKSSEFVDQITKTRPSEQIVTKNETVDKAGYPYKNNLPAVGPEKNSALAIGGLTSNDAGQVKKSRNWLLAELNPIGKINPTVVAFKLPILKLPEKEVLSSKNKPKYYSESVKSILKKMNYYVGASFDAGNGQIGGSLLGEVQVTPKWSFQTGVRWTQLTGDNYFTAEQYSQQTGDDFRTLYAPYVAQNVDLLNIEQNYQLVQIPLMVAYHYEVLPNWTLRFGVGTDLSVYSQKHIHFDYKENNLSFDQGEYNAKLALKAFNDLTINLGMERRWNKFLFRVSPYITPQLRRNEYSKDDLSWGARVQILYKFR